MFKNKNNLLIPQSEHLRISGIIAQNWGNETFEKPQNFQTFFKAVAIHDKVFGISDDNILGEITIELRKKQIENWINSSYDSLDEKLHVLFHVRRIIKDVNLDLYNLVDLEINKIKEENQVDLKYFKEVDTIMDVCDLASFLFCFGENKSSQVDTYNKSDSKIKLSIEINNNKIILNPWPLSVDNLKGYILGYKSIEDMNNFNPQIIEFEICKK